jgi:hypothetical protein
VPNGSSFYSMEFEGRPADGSFVKTGDTQDWQLK